MIARKVTMGDYLSTDMPDTLKMQLEIIRGH